MKRRLRYLSLAFVLGLAACGGGSMDDALSAGDPGTPAPPQAADCFNPQLFTPGTSYSLDYQLTGNPGGTLSYVSAVQAYPATGPADVVTVTTTNVNFNPPVPGTIVLFPDRKRFVQTIEGTDIVTKDEFQLAPTWTSEGEFPYSPFLRDRRYGLAQGASFALVRSYAGSSTTVTSTITYAGQESVTVPAGTYTACKFQEQSADGSVVATWVAKGKGLVVKQVASTQTQELMATSRLNGQPV